MFSGDILYEGETWVVYKTTKILHGCSLISLYHCSWETQPIQLWSWRAVWLDVERGPLCNTKFNSEVHRIQMIKLCALTSICMVSVV